MFKNTVKSGFKRCTIKVAYSFPIHELLYEYIQFFSGYAELDDEYHH